MTDTPANNYLLAFVGMPGAGKTEAVMHLQKQGIPFVRFGDLTDEGLKEKGLPQTPQNEQQYREQVRQELGMAAYAIKAEPKIHEVLINHTVAAIDGLYSWEEYKYLKERFPQLQVVFIYAEPTIRYSRLAKRPIRPFTPDEARARDIAEIEKLHKGGSIAIADYLIVNNSEDLNELHGRIDELFQKLGVKL